MKSTEEEVVEVSRHRCVVHSEGLERMLHAVKGDRVPHQLHHEAGGAERGGDAGAGWGGGTRDERLRQDGTPPPNEVAAEKGVNLRTGFHVSSGERTQGRRGRQERRTNHEGASPTPISLALSLSLPPLLCMLCGMLYTCHAAARARYIYILRRAQGRGGFTRR